MSIANWVKETTATAGTGTITLSGAITGHTTFASQFEEGEFINYLVTEGNDKALYSGIYSAGTLTIAIVHSTLIAGTLNKATATALTLVGSAEVSIVPNSVNVKPLTPSVVQANSEYYSAYNFGNAANGPAKVVDRMYAIQWVVDRRIHVDGLGHRSNSPAATGTIARMGIYLPDSNGYPEKLLAESSGTHDLSITTISQVVSVTTPIWLEPGLYYLAILTDTDVVMRSHADNDNIAPNNVPAFTNADRGYSWFSYDVAPGWVAMPDPIAGGSYQAANPTGHSPMLFARTV